MMVHLERIDHMILASIPVGKMAVLKFLLDCPKICNFIRHNYICLPMTFSLTLEDLQRAFIVFILY
jgi:hypothetical protein